MSGSSCRDRSAGTSRLGPSPTRLARSAPPVRAARSDASGPIGSGHPSPAACCRSSCVSSRDGAGRQPRSDDGCTLHVERGGVPGRRSTGRCVCVDASRGRWWQGHCRSGRSIGSTSAGRQSIDLKDTPAARSRLTEPQTPARSRGREAAVGDMGSRGRLRAHGSRAGRAVRSFFHHLAFIRLPSGGRGVLRSGLHPLHDSLD